MGDREPLRRSTAQADQDQRRPVSVPIATMGSKAQTSFDERRTQVAPWGTSSRPSRPRIRTADPAEECPIDTADPQYRD